MGRGRGGPPKTSKRLGQGPVTPAHNVPGLGEGKGPSQVSAHNKPKALEEARKGSWSAPTSNPPTITHLGTSGSQGHPLALELREPRGSASRQVASRLKTTGLDELRGWEGRGNPSQSCSLVRHSYGRGSNGQTYRCQARCHSQRPPAQDTTGRYFPQASHARARRGRGQAATHEVVGSSGNGCHLHTIADVRDKRARTRAKSWIHAGGGVQ